MRKHVAPILIILLCTALSVLLHLKWCGTPMSAPEPRWQDIFNYHRTFYPLSIRPLTTYPILFVHQLSGLSLKWVFFVEQYALMAILGLVFLRCLRTLGLSKPWTYLGLCLLMLSFPILFAHSEPVFTWDDSWAYLFLLLCVVALMGGRIWTASLLFLLGCFAREQTLFYTPVLWLGTVMFGAGDSRLRKLIANLAPIVIYGAYYAIMLNTPPKTLSELWDINFGTLPRITNSLFSIFISFGAAWVAWVCALMSYKRNTNKTSDRPLQFLIWGSILTVLPTLFVGLFLAQTRETRLFFPPFVFILPLALLWLRDHWTTLQTQSHFARMRLILITAVGTAAAFVLLYVTRPGLEYRNCPDFCYLWAGLHFGLSVGVIGLAWLTAGRGRSASAGTRVSASD